MNSKFNKLSKNKIFKINKKSKKLSKFKKDLIVIKNKLKTKQGSMSAFITRRSKQGPLGPMLQSCNGQVEPGVR